MSETDQQHEQAGQQPGPVANAPAQDIQSDQVPEPANTGGGRTKPVYKIRLDMLKLVEARGGRAAGPGAGGQGTAITPTRSQLNNPPTNKPKTPNSPTTNATVRPTQTDTGTSSNAD